MSWIHKVWPLSSYSNYLYVQFDVVLFTTMYKIQAEWTSIQAEWMRMWIWKKEVETMKIFETAIDTMTNQS